MIEEKGRMMGDKLDTREKILAAAKLEFLQHGFEKASMRIICKKANVTTGAAYFFFRDKDDIFYQLVSDKAEELLNRIIVTESENEKIRENDEIPIESASDIDASKIKDIMKYMYDNIEIFILLFCKSIGSSMENFYDSMIEIVENLSRKYIMNKRDTGEISVYFDENTYHNLVSLEISSIIEPIRHQLPREEALKQVDAIAKFFYGGWNELMHFKKK
ncbi:TetR/AcrR family transcriptional regulator [Haloimpatiens sp. FM7330]